MRTIPEQQVITKTTYTADGTTDIYNVPFEYLSKAHVIVTADGKTEPYEWLTDHSIKFDAPPQAGALIIIERQTPYDEAFVKWTDGSVMFSDDLNNQLLQVLYVLQENKQALEGALAYDDLKGAYDALGNRITNLGDPQDPQDAVTYITLQQQATELLQEIAAVKTALETKHSADVTALTNSINTLAGNLADLEAEYSAAINDALGDMETLVQQAADSAGESEEWAEASCECARRSGDISRQIEAIMQSYAGLYVPLDIDDGQDAETAETITVINDGEAPADTLQTANDGKSSHPGEWYAVDDDVLQALNPKGITDISEIDENGEITITVDNTI